MPTVVSRLASAIIGIVLWAGWRVSSTMVIQMRHQLASAIVAQVTPIAPSASRRSGDFRTLVDLHMAAQIDARLRQ